MTAMIRVRRLPHAEGIDLPRYQSPGAAGMDLLAAIAPQSRIVIEPGAHALVPTGIVLALPAGYEAQVRPRSGLALRHGVTVLNAPGTIDADYRGEVGVVLINHGAQPYEIVRGARIAQIVFARVETVTLVEGEIDATERGLGGFGSTGLDGRLPGTMPTS